MSNWKKDLKTNIFQRFVLPVCIVTGIFSQSFLSVYAEDVYNGEIDLVWDDFYSDNDDAIAWETTEEYDFGSISKSAAINMVGSYTIPDGWLEDTSVTFPDTKVLKQEMYMGIEYTSTITCSYMDTSYSVYEYEQLREMLTNNLVFTDVNAQISSSAGYTEAKDYLYILISDDSNKEFRDIYYYVVGDYRCFCVTVKEYRQEAAVLSAGMLDTPQQAAKRMVDKFIWDAAW